jgi:hypothetical protein
MKALSVLLASASLLLAGIAVPRTAEVASMNPSGYSQAKLLYEEYGLAFAFQQSSILEVAASRLASDAVGPHKAAYNKGIEELRKLAAIPETSVTAAQKAQASASIKALDVFFDTPSLYITVGIEPKVSPLHFPKCGAANLIELERVQMTSSWIVTVVFRRAQVVCRGQDDIGFSVYGSQMAEKLRTDAAIFGLNVAETAKTHIQLGPTTLQSWESGETNRSANWYVYALTAGVISAMTEVYEP